METVTFLCGHCNHLMGVSLEHLGRPVRCPHCSQVVLAPTSPSSPSSAPSSSLESPFLEWQQHEDIFHASSASEDPLFGGEDRPRLELPLEPSPASLPQVPSDLHPAHASETTSSSQEMGWLPPLQSEVSASPPSLTDATPNTAAWTNETNLSEPQPLVSMGGSESPSSNAIRRAREQSTGVNWFIPLVFIPLVLYAVLATAVAGYLWMLRQVAPPSLFDRMPDLEGDTPGVRREKVRAPWRFERRHALAPLPAHLHVQLGETIQIGDLQVKPWMVERRKVALLVEGSEEDPAESPTDALVLHLELKNLASAYAFTPLDNYFDRKWKPGSDSSTPLTVLQAGEQAFFGGPANWVPLQQTRRPRREWLHGRLNVDREGLRPGETMRTLIATDAWDPDIARYLFGVGPDGNLVGKPYKGKLLWRVQLRRGLVSWRGREVPATAVIGVEFSDKDYTS